MDIIAAVGEAFTTLADPFRLVMLCCGVVMGLFLGIVPGIGGLSGMALLLPFTYTMDPYAAFAMLLGMSAVTGTSDTIPAVLFGVPGSSSAQATVMDGNPMAKRGEAGRALSAAYTSSLIGGLFGAVLLGFSIPVLRPLILHIASPELLAFTLFGISMVAILSGKAPMRGMIAAGFGIMISMVGAEPQTGTMRWTFGTIYLWDGLPLVPMILGMFALPELADLAIKRQAITQDAKYDVRAGMWVGIKDSFQHWWLVMRCGMIGAGVGALPGIGSQVVDWIAYSHALQTEKGATKTFGKGDVRGVIAPESANNAITAGALVPTIAFGVPGSASMAILLSVFLIHGLVPGPEMLTVNLNVTYTMVWSVVLANILGAGICLLFSGQLAKIALLRYTLILPAVMVFVYLGSFQASRQWGDLYTLMAFAVLGWTMKQLKWPRPPLILGIVLGTLIERYMFISITRYGADWLTRPVVVVMLVLSLLLIISPIWRHYRGMGGVRGIVRNFSAPQFRLPDLLHVFLIGVVGYMVLATFDWPWTARIGPEIIGTFTVGLGIVSLLNQVFSRAIISNRIVSDDDIAAHNMHLDSTADFGGLTVRQIVTRALTFAGYLALIMGLIASIGFLLTIPVFVTLYMWMEARESWKHFVGQSVVLVVFMYIVFDQLLRVPWPQTLIGQWFPVLKAIPSV